MTSASARQNWRHIGKYARETQKITNIIAQDKGNDKNVPQDCLDNNQILRDREDYVQIYRVTQEITKSLQETERITY